MMVWEYWLSLYHFSNTQAVSIAHKFTDEHVYLTSRLKMRNHLAEQVLDKDALSSFKVYMVKAVIENPLNNY